MSPAPKRDVGVIDPYVTVVDQPPWSAPPNPGAPTTDNHMLTLNVPRPEGSTLTMGAGDVPGIRMESGTHVHLTAGSPETSISLGAGAGKGAAGSPAGLVLSTQGNLTVFAKGPAKETFENTFDETVTGKASSTFEADLKVNAKADGNLEFKTRTCTVHGQSVDFRESDQTTTITGNYTLTSGARSETVNGDYTINAIGHTVTINATNLKLVYDNKDEEIHNQDTSKNHGAKTENYLGIKESRYLAGQMAFTLGTKTEVTAALNMAIHATNMSRSVLNIAFSTVKAERIGFSKKETLVDLDKKDVQLTKVGAAINSFGILIVK